MTYTKKTYASNEPDASDLERGRRSGENRPPVTNIQITSTHIFEHFHGPSQYLTQSQDSSRRRRRNSVSIETDLPYGGSGSGTLDVKYSESQYRSRSTNPSTRIGRRMSESHHDQIPIRTERIERKASQSRSRASDNREQAARARERIDAHYTGQETNKRWREWQREVEEAATRFQPTNTLPRRSSQKQKSPYMEAQRQEAHAESAWREFRERPEREVPQAEQVYRQQQEDIRGRSRISRKTKQDSLAEKARQQYEEDTRAQQRRERQKQEAAEAEEVHRQEERDAKLRSQLAREQKEMETEGARRQAERDAIFERKLGKERMDKEAAETRQESGNRASSNQSRKFTEKREQTEERSHNNSKDNGRQPRPYGPTIPKMSETQGTRPPPTNPKTSPPGSKTVPAPAMILFWGRDYELIKLASLIRGATEDFGPPGEGFKPFIELAHDFSKQFRHLLLWTPFCRSAHLRAESGRIVNDFLIIMHECEGTMKKNIGFTDEMGSTEKEQMVRALWFEKYQGKRTLKFLEDLQRWNTEYDEGEKNHT